MPQTSERAGAIQAGLPRAIAGLLRSDEGVELELTDLLRTTAGDRDLRGPVQGRLPRGRVDDGEAAAELLELPIGVVGDRPVTGHQDRFDALVQPAAEDVHAGIPGLLDDSVGVPGHVGTALLGDVHRSAGERNQVPRHPMTPLFGRPHPAPPSSCLLYTSDAADE